MAGTEARAPRAPVKRAAAAVAEAAIRRTGARVTRQRTTVLAVLVAAARALTHHEVERGLAIDRVTVYRVLEWLTRQGLAHKIAGEDRIWRFNAAADARERAHAHAHFECSGCGEVLCLDEVRTEHAIRLPSGYRRSAVQLTVKGYCAGCTPARKRA